MTVCSMTPSTIIFFWKTLLNKRLIIIWGSNQQNYRWRFGRQNENAWTYLLSVPWWLFRQPCSCKSAKLWLQRTWSQFQYRTPIWAAQWASRWVHCPSHWASAWPGDWSIWPWKWHDETLNNWRFQSPSSQSTASVISWNISTMEHSTCHSGLMFGPITRRGREQWCPVG